MSIVKNFNGIVPYTKGEQYKDTLNFDVSPEYAVVSDHASERINTRKIDPRLISNSMKTCISLCGKQPLKYLVYHKVHGMVFIYSLEKDDEDTPLLVMKTVFVQDSTIMVKGLIIDDETPRPYTLFITKL